MYEFGYELIYRNNIEDRAALEDANQATAEVTLNTFDIGLEELVGKRLAFINCDRSLIMSNHCESLPKDRVVLDMVETIELDEALINRLSELKSSGYRISVKCSQGSKWLDPLLQTANFVRFDVTSNAGIGIERSIAMVQRFPVKLIAERIETREQFEQCKAMAFDYFQGYFFCKPELVEGKRTSANRLLTLHMMAILTDPQTKINDIVKAISLDAGLAYKLLRYSNSAMAGVQRPVESIKHAIVLIGMEKIRIWASLLLLYGFEDKPRDIIVIGATRARMCEELAKTLGAENPETFFLVGLLSVLDAIIDQPIGEALASLPLSRAVNDAILYQKGELGAVLKCVLAYERRNWVVAKSAVNLTQGDIRQAYVNAVGWSLRTFSELTDPHETA